MTTADRARPSTADGGTFSAGQPGWVNAIANVRNVVRQELISRQLARHLPSSPARVLDVGASQGRQSIRLARAGHHVLAVEPDAQLRTMFAAAVTAEPAGVRARVTLVDGSIGNLAAASG